jgi:hypothetical protein
LTIKIFLLWEKATTNINFSIIVSSSMESRQAWLDNITESNSVDFV